MQSTPLFPSALPRSQAGFTAVELLTVIAVLAVLAALAAPSFNSLMESWRVRQASEALQSSLFFARSEAIKRGGNIVVRKLPNNTNGCTSAPGNDDWGCGWLVCDTTVNAACNPSGTVLQRYDTPPRIEVTRKSGGDRLILDRWGAITGTYAGFSLVPLGRPTTDPATRGVCMNRGGRIRATLPADTPCSG
ncbi:MAG: GspH/FimT family pseudopilin [Pseudomonadota bacterium]|nr:GspH/FimT family pseudopilin [Pseudomonadota bacterium]